MRQILQNTWHGQVGVITDDGTTGLRDYGLRDHWLRDTRDLWVAGNRLRLAIRSVDASEWASQGPGRGRARAMFGRVANRSMVPG